MRYHKTILTSAISAVLVAGTAFATDAGDHPEDQWVSVTGTVTTKQADQFTLDYGEGELIVGMENWDGYGRDWPLVENDQVTVYGKVDPDVFLNDRIVDASSVHVEGLNTFFYASEADKDELGDWALDSGAEFGDLTYIGTVESVSPASDSFTMGIGNHDVTVHTAAMPNDMLDDSGFQQIDQGDRVIVEGDVEDDFFDDGDLWAESIITLST